jgi:hypothetical protein
MPIKKELYPPNWPEISASIRQRAGNKCESCGVANHAVGARDRFGEWRDEMSIHQMNSGDGFNQFGEEFPEMIRIVLTVAHLNQNPADNRPENLKCLCQRCHLNHDRPFNMPKIRETWARKRRARIAQTGQLSFEGLE